ncbi:DNA mismatch repair endonuclease MutL [Pontibacter sp. G13]|uniref:DNA mismatch repair endonuclease MutL n=1 Tax=Pontibacter sp. G13 TaxID=3074898 RepID=UPI00288A0C43|nr:DNA mismatch repair endonuclease MutL [Pontibacter sp. G13]WNJ19598.1 DNA mismatch repair endonuclease MutL [Pontibacter sp. G13]
MQNQIRLLPDAIANQIAAGEVVQRPASVIKELLENAIDAGATKIDILIKDAGKALIQVTDNGSGMSPQDARMAFERHATSKIQKQEDLFNILTLGFRGEALASIAAVAQVKVKTRRADDELGTEIEIEASQIKKESPIVMPQGTTFQVRNLFYNVPARRNFLTSDSNEIRHLQSEIVRVAIAHPEVAFTYQLDTVQIYDFPAADLKHRLLATQKNSLAGKLHEVSESTGYVKISGYVGDPSAPTTKRKDRYFFVNGRYIRSNSLNHAIRTAYEDFLEHDQYPFYCIFLELDPVHVDINIHPTKTEVKFDDERTLFVLLHTIVKRVLGEAHNAPELPGLADGVQPGIFGTQPTITPQAPDFGKVDFGREDAGQTIGNVPRIPKTPSAKSVDPAAWDQLYKPITPPQPSSSVNPSIPPVPPPFDSPEKIGNLFGEGDIPSGVVPTSQDRFVAQYSQRYILTSRGGDLIIIDQHLAHRRILYERFLARQSEQAQGTQRLLFSQELPFSASESALMKEVQTVLSEMGFEVTPFGMDSLVVHGIPAGIPMERVQEVFEQILDEVKLIGSSAARTRLMEGIARAIARKSSVTSSQKLSILEMNQMIDDLFACQVPGFAPNGKPTFKQVSGIELEEYFR